MYTALTARCVLTLEWVPRSREFFEPRKNLPDHVFAEAGADPSGIGEMFVVVDSCKQRTEAAAFARPSAEHDFLAGAALRLSPVALAGTIDLAQTLRDDTFE